MTFCALRPSWTTMDGTMVSSLGCDAVEDLLALQASGTVLAPETAAQLAAHLARCADCAAVAATSAPTTDARGDRTELPPVEPSAYAIGRELARGGMGRILEARDLRIGRPVAVKELLGTAGARASLAARFEREARVTARLQHPGIVPIYEIGAWPDGTPFYSMRLVEGKTLFSAIAASTTLDERLALLPSIIAAVEAVAFAHAQRVIHRDLTPSNIMIGAYGETVVIDWGLAKDLSTTTDEPDLDVGPYRAEPAAEGLTATGAVIGTAAYMPPEQARGDPVGEHGDVYALGAILYHLLAGVAPYRGKSSVELLEKLRLGPPKPIATAASSAPRDLLSIVEKAMRREREERYPSAQQLAEELRRFQTGRIVEAHAYTRGELVRRWVRRHRAAVIGVAVVALVVLVGGAWSLRSILRESERADAERADAIAQRDVATAEQQRASAMTVALLEEQGRQELLAGEPQKALAYLNAAMQGGLDTPALRLMLGMALRSTVDGPDLTCDGVITDLEIAERTIVAICGPEIVAWARDTGALRFRAPMANAAVARFSADGKTLAIAGERSAVLDGATGALRLVLDANDAGQHVTIRGDEIVLVTTSKIRRFDLATGALRRTHDLGLRVGRRVGPLSKLAADGRTLAVAAETGAIEIWNLEQGTRLAAMALGFPLKALDISSDGTRVVACGEGPDVVAWNTRTGARTWSSNAKRILAVACQFDSRGERVLIASGDGVSEIWELATNRALVRVAETAQIKDAMFSPDDRHFVELIHPNTVRMRSSVTGDEVAMLANSATHVRFLGASEVAIGNRNTLVRWRISALHGAFAPPDGEILSAVSLDARFALTRRSDDHGTLWDVASGQSIATGKHGAMSWDGKRFAFSASPRSIRVLDSLTRQIVARYEAPDEIGSLGLDRQGTQLLATNKTRTWVWRVGANEHRELDGTPSGTTWSLDGSQLALSTKDAIVVYSMTDKPPVRLPSTGLHDSQGIDASGERIVIREEVGDIGIVGEISVWDLTRGTRMFTIVGSAMSYDSEARLLGYHDRGAITVRDVVTGRLIGSQAVVQSELDGYVDLLPVPSRDGAFVLAQSSRYAAEVRSATDGRLLVAFGQSRRRLMLSGPWVWWHDVGAVWIHADGADDQVISTAGNVSVWSLSMERRPAAEIDRIVRARVPWRLENGQLVTVTSQLAGRVLHGGAPVADAIVVARRQPHNSPYRTRTQADGTFVLDRLPEGSYVIEAQVGDARSGQQRVRSGANVELTLP